MSEIFNLSIWSAGYRDLDTLRQHNSNIKTIIIDQAVEAVTSHYNRDDEGIKKIITEFPDKNYIIISSNYSKFDKLNHNYKIFKNITEIEYPAYWITKTVNEVKCEYTRDDTNLKNEIDFYDNNVNLFQPISYLFLSLNNNYKYHRSLTMDLLCKFNLIEKGAISFRDIACMNNIGYNSDPDSCPVNYNNFPYKYWTPKRMYLDQPLEKDKSIQQYQLPIQIKNSFMQIVPESVNDIIFITEKTVTPLLFNKLFLSVAKEKFHATLVDLGFKLYTNVFDYSFDDEPDLEKRIIGIIKNIKRYENYSNTDLQNIINQNIDIIKYNRKLAIEYCFERVPPVLFEINDKLILNDLPKLWLNLGSKQDYIDLKNKFYN